METVEAVDNAHCDTCGAFIGNEEECDYCTKPEDYVTPGTESLMYINAYEVTRHYCGPEEGGDWQNYSHPLASIPVKATSHKGCSHSYCLNCNNGNHCKWSFHLVPNEPSKVDMFKSHLEDVFSHIPEGNIYSVLGGAELSIRVENNPAKPSEFLRYE